MFSVYGVGGQIFRGSLDKLRQIGGVSAIARTNAIQSVGTDGQDDPSSTHPAFFKPSPRRSREDANRNALTAYDQPVLARHPLSQVDALMSRSVITIPDVSTVLQAWEILFQQGVGQAPVVNGTGTLVGLLSRADLLSPDRLPRPDSNMLVWRALLAQSVRDIMITPVPSVAPDADIRHVARVLLDSGLPGLPVVTEQGLVTGFVARSDILRAVVTDPPLDLWG